MRKVFRKVLLASLLICNGGFALAQKWFTPEVEKQVDAILSQMTVQEKLDYISGDFHFQSKTIDRLGIPAMKMSDGPQGLGTRGNSTAYPCMIALASTWNEDIAYKYGTALGQDCRARGVHMLLGPAVNIHRAPMCGRNFEYTGEDPYLASRVAVGYIKGVQDQGVMATIKHFIANNSDYNRDWISNDIDERTVHEIYFPAFKAAVQEAEVGVVMSSYNLYNGIYTTEHPWLLKEVLRNQWGFNGMVVSDWSSSHYAIPTYKGGLDLEMPGAERTKPADMKYYLRTGDLTMDIIDEKVRHILRVLIGFGFKDKQQEDKNIPMNNPASAKTALEVANEAIVLLKNEKNILPVNPKKYKKIAIVGKNATGYICGGGSGAVRPYNYVSTLDGIRTAAEKYGVQVDYIDEYDYFDPFVFTGSDLKQKGFKASYYNNTRLEGNPVVEQIDSKINGRWTNGTELQGMPKDHFSVRWTGTICSKKDAEYEFTLGGDDGYRMVIDGKAVIDEYRAAAYRSTKYKMQLKAGQKYDVRIEYFQEGGSASVNLTWRNQGEGDNLFVERLNQSDMVIACFGFNSDTEAEASDRTFDLPVGDKFLIETVLQSKKPVVGIVNAGGNVEMQSWQPSLKGLLWSWYVGQEGGTAIANVLFGEVNPSGKLPITFEKKWEDNPTYDNYYDPDGDMHVEYKEGIFVGYRGYDKLNREVQYPFGFGMSYTTFRLSDMKVSQDPNDDKKVKVTCKLTNTGKRAGAEVVQLYVGKPSNNGIEQPLKELKSFKKVYLEPKQSAEVEINLSKEAFSYYNMNKKAFVVDPGVFKIMLGVSSRNIIAQQNVTLK